MAKNINLVNTSKIGIAVWGSKMGKSIFAYSNITSHSNILFNLEDATSYINLSGQDWLFFSTYKYNDNIGVTIYRTIYDQANQNSYQAITLFIPLDMYIEGERLMRLLIELSDIYKRYYIAMNNSRLMIKRGVREDISLFLNILNKPEYALRKLSQNCTFYDSNALIGYEYKSQLYDIFDYLFMVTNYRFCYIIDIQHLSPISGFQMLNVSQIIRDVNEEKSRKTFVLHLFDEKTQKGISGNISISTKSVAKSNNILIPATGRSTINIKKLSDNETLTIKCTADGYEPRIINYTVGTLYNSDTRTYNIDIALKAIPVLKIKVLDENNHPYAGNYDIYINDIPVATNYHGAYKYLLNNLNANNFEIKIKPVNDNYQSKSYTYFKNNYADGGEIAIQLSPKILFELKMLDNNNKSVDLTDYYVLVNNKDKLNIEKGKIDLSGYYDKTTLRVISKKDKNISTEEKIINLSTQKQKITLTDNNIITQDTENKITSQKPKGNAKDKSEGTIFYFFNEEEKLVRDIDVKIIYPSKVQETKNTGKDGKIGINLDRENPNKKIKFKVKGYDVITKNDLIINKLKSKKDVTVKLIKKDNWITKRFLIFASVAIVFIGGSLFYLDRGTIFPAIKNIFVSQKDTTIVNDTTNIVDTTKKSPAISQKDTDTASTVFVKDSITTDTTNNSTNPEKKTISSNPIQRKDSSKEQSSNNTNTKEQNKPNDPETRISSPVNQKEITDLLQKIRKEIKNSDFDTNIGMTLDKWTKRLEKLKYNITTQLRDSITNYRRAAIMLYNAHDYKNRLDENYKNNGNKKFDKLETEITLKKGNKLILDSQFINEYVTKINSLKEIVTFSTSQKKHIGKKSQILHNIAEKVFKNSNK